MTHTVSDSALGKATEYISQYDASLLYPIARSQSRAALALTDLPFYGVDVWTAYEVSWLNARGMPQSAVAEFVFAADSANIIESKSFKLYLNSFNQTAFARVDEVQAVLVRDLSHAAGAPVIVQLNKLADCNAKTMLASFTDMPSAVSLDNQDIAIDCYHPQPDYLRVGNDTAMEILVSDILKTNCPVTGQPDWASIYIEYSGAAICHEGLLRYLVSFREHQDFHEHCVERIFCDITARCQPDSLSVYARYTRRGGLDINPFRSSDPKAAPPAARLWRQ
ncbi:MAG TPA: NADPH-dependent 7-cyano-7-deazaguanine reductase QueF [Cellvibrionaceae bacterium]